MRHIIHVRVKPQYILTYLINVIITQHDISNAAMTVWKYYRRNTCSKVEHMYSRLLL